jgi:hypothetical protein
VRFGAPRCNSHAVGLSELLECPILAVGEHRQVVDKIGAGDIPEAEDVAEGDGGDVQRDAVEDGTERVERLGCSPGEVELDGVARPRSTPRR